MKKLLIVQQDSAYFLFETLQVLEKNHSALKDFETTILVNSTSLSEVYTDTSPILSGITTDEEAVLVNEFDLSVNLSLLESSWKLHGKVISQKKIGPYTKDDQVMVPDLWSTYLMTLKTQAPFLSFHLQDIYKCILGIRGFTKTKTSHNSALQFAIGMTSLNLFPANEQEAFIHGLTERFPHIPIRDISEIDIISDVAQTIYIGPATLESLKFCEAGGKGIFLSSYFQGFNFLPYTEGHIFISSSGKQLQAKHLLEAIYNEIENKSNYKEIEYCLYRTDHENIFGTYLKSLNHSDDNYPFYQSHVVLWNFLLNLFDTNLEITKCSDEQLKIMKTNQEVLTKFLRLHDYAMVSIDTIYHEAKSTNSDHNKIHGHLRNLREIEELTEKISASHSILRPILDFYRIRRGQNTAQTLLDQSQNSLLIYSEEHQALTALNELISVTIERNSANI